MNKSIKIDDKSYEKLKKEKDKTDVPMVRIIAKIIEKTIGKK